jgi:hypothetical protein
MRYYAARNLIYCLRYRTVSTILWTMFFMFVILTGNKMMHEEQHAVETAPTQYTEEQLAYCRWLWADFTDQQQIARVCQ